MNIRHWFTKNAVETASTVVEQTRKNLQKNAQTKVAKKGEAWLTIGKLIFLGVTLFGAIKDLNKTERERLPQPSQIPTTININNYIRENERSTGNG